jgi:hypothetical protein
LVVREALAILPAMRSTTLGIVLALFMPACGGSMLDEGKDLFNLGKYSDARDKLDKVGASEYKAFDVRTRATYALYRGLVFGALGEKKDAAAWLGLAKQSEENHPGALNHDDAVRLRLAEQQYGPWQPMSESTSAP